jgi:hypothetical protein
MIKDSREFRGFLFGRLRVETKIYPKGVYRGFQYIRHCVGGGRVVGWRVLKMAGGGGWGWEVRNVRGPCVNNQTVYHPQSALESKLNIAF